MKQKKLQERLKAVRIARKTSDLVVHRDWVQVHLLAGFARSAMLSSTLVFKGGTALQKIFFGEAYRFSEDLDFTGLEGAPRGDDLLRALEDLCTDVARETTALIGEPVTLALRRHEDASERQESFTIEFTLPWQERSFGGVKIEITFDEPVLLGAERRPLAVRYDGVTCEVLCYSIEEIVLEKMRGAPQTLMNTKKREATGKTWMRARSRDYYDLWSIVSSSIPISWDAVRGKLDDKCAVRGVSITGIGDVFIEEILDNVRKQWEAQLKDFVGGGLPDVEQVLTALKPTLCACLGWVDADT